MEETHLSSFQSSTDPVAKYINKIENSPIKQT